VRIDIPNEVDYYRNGGILHLVYKRGRLLYEFQTALSSTPGMEP